jgi:hypothetical protein
MYLEWIPLKPFQGSQPIDLPPRAVTIGVLAEFGELGINFHVSAGRGIGLSGPPLNVTRFDTALLYVFSAGTVFGFFDIGTGLLQFESLGTQFWRTNAWIGFGLRVKTFDFMRVVFEAKRMALIVWENIAGAQRGTWVVKLEVLIVGL